MMKEDQKRSGICRRDFIGNSLAALAGLGIIDRNNLYDGKARTLSREPRIREYRTLGRTGFKVSDIGFGASFLTVPELLKVALDRGINYIDTGEHYSNGQSERTIGRVLQNQDRKSIFITTKLNLTFMQSRTKEDVKQRFQKCLERLQTDYVDCLMIHMARDTEQIKHPAFHEAARELKAEGRIRYIGLSNHGPEFRIYGRLQVPMEQVVCAAVEDGRFDVVLIAYNFLQREQGEKILKKCQEKNVGVTLMKTDPVNVYSRVLESVEQEKKAGAPPSAEYMKRLEDYATWLKAADQFIMTYGLKTNEQVREAAIKFVLGQPGVHSACLSITTFEKLETFVALSGEKLESRDHKMLGDYKDRLGPYYCRHACGLCEPACPHTVPINTIMRYNHYFQAQGREKYSMVKYAALPGTDAGQCTTCAGYCQHACPYGVHIHKLLVLAHNTLTLA